MLQTRAIIIRQEGKEALVESMQGSGCGNCDSQGGCGSSKLPQLFCSEPRRFWVRNETNAQVGTMVQIAVAEGLLLRSALLIYMLPLLLLLGGAFSGTQLANDEASRDVYAALGAMTGLIAGFALVKAVSLRPGLPLLAQPVIMPSADASLGVNE